MTPHWLSASMGPPPFGDGDHDPRQAVRVNGGLSAMETADFAQPGPCFNGATAFRRWKDYEPVQGWTASMGRRGAQLAWLQWGHRLSAMESAGWTGGWCNCWSLQWGHRLSAMEIGLQPLPFFGRVVASMGPPPFGDGNTQAPRFGRHCGIGGFNGATAFRRWKQAYFRLAKRRGD